VDGGDLREDGDALLLVVGGQALELVPEDVDERRPVRDLTVEALERLVRVRVCGIGLEDRFVLLDRLERVVGRLGEPRDLRAQLLLEGRRRAWSAALR
jgi:hypothetical protein